MISSLAMRAESSPGATLAGAGPGDGEPGFLLLVLPAAPVVPLSVSVAELPSSALRFVADAGGVGDAAREPGLLAVGLVARLVSCGGLAPGEAARDPGGPADPEREGPAEGPPGYFGPLL